MIKRHVVIQLTTEMLGTVPKDKEIYTTYIESKRPEDLDQPPEVDTVQNDLEARGWSGFHSDENGLFVYDYFIKGFLKNAGNILKNDLALKNLRSKLSDFLFVQPRRIRLGKENPDGVIERPLRAQTPQGPRTSLARSDYVAAGTVIEFDIVYLNHADISDKVIKELLSYGQLQGLGQFRNGGYGRFEVLSYGDEAVVEDVAPAPKKREKKAKVT